MWNSNGKSEFTIGIPHFKLCQFFFPAAVWDWNAKRQEIKVSPIVESRLGLQGGELSGKVSEFLKYVHSDDRDRFRLQLAFIH